MGAGLVLETTSRRPRYIFQENLDMFMGYIAHLGEVCCRLSNYCWGWLPSLGGRFSEPLEFGLVFHKITVLKLAHK